MITIMINFFKSGGWAEWLPRYSLDVFSYYDVRSDKVNVFARHSSDNFYLPLVCDGHLFSTCSSRRIYIVFIRKDIGDKALMDKVEKMIIDTWAPQCDLCCVLSSVYLMVLYL